MAVTQYYETEETKRLEFARKAARHFEENPASVTFSNNGPEPGELMAFRYGGGGDCVLVFKIDEYEPIINYCQFIDRGKARKHEAFNDAGLKTITD